MTIAVGETEFVAASADRLTAEHPGAPPIAGIVAKAFLGERFHTRRILAVAAGFLGAIVILRPGFQSIETGSIAHPQDDATDVPKPGVPWWRGVLPFLLPAARSPSSAEESKEELLRVMLNRQ